MKPQRFEIFYYSGGHGGPYRGIREARKAARRLLLGLREPWIDIRRYTLAGYQQFERIERTK